MTIKLFPIAIAIVGCIAACDSDDPGTSPADAAPGVIPDAQPAADSAPLSPCEGSNDPTCVDSAGVQLSYALFRTESSGGQLRIIISESSHHCDDTDVDPAAATITLAAPASPGTYTVAMVEAAWATPPAGSAAVIYSTGEAHANRDDDGSYTGTVTIAAVGAVITGSLDAVAATHGTAMGSFVAMECDDLDFR